MAIPTPLRLPGTSAFELLYLVLSWNMFAIHVHVLKFVCTMSMCVSVCLCLGLAEYGLTLTVLEHHRPFHLSSLIAAKLY